MKQVCYNAQNICLRPPALKLKRESREICKVASHSTWFDLELGLNCLDILEKYCLEQLLLH